MICPLCGERMKNGFAVVPSSRYNTGIQWYYEETLEKVNSRKIPLVKMSEQLSCIEIPRQSSRLGSGSPSCLCEKCKTVVLISKITEKKPENPKIW